MAPGTRPAAKAHRVGWEQSDRVVRGCSGSVLRLLRLLRPLRLLRLLRAHECHHMPYPTTNSTTPPASPAAQHHTTPAADPSALQASYLTPDPCSPSLPPHPHLQLLVGLGEGGDPRLLPVVLLRLLLDRLDGLLEDDGARRLQNGPLSQAFWVVPYTFLHFCMQIIF